MEERKINRITIKEFDERFYELDGVYKPSVTYILGVGMPASPHLIEWIAKVGLEQAEQIKTKAGDEGSFVHDCIDRLLKGDTLPSFEMDLKSKRCLQAFVDWFVYEKPQVISHEYIIWGKDYAGTVDFKCRLKSDDYKKVWLIDHKTSKSIHENHKAQLMAYKKADPEVDRVALLHLGNTTKKRYSFCEIRPSDELKYWHMFQCAKKMFQIMKPDAKPTIEEYPEFFKLDLEIITKFKK